MIAAIYLIVSIRYKITNDVLSTPLDAEQGLSEYYFRLVIGVMCIFYYTTQCPHEMVSPISSLEKWY